MMELYLRGKKVRAKLEQQSSVLDRQYQEKEEPRRTNLNDLLKRSKAEKAKMKKTNVLVFSAVIASASLVVVIISFL